MGITGDFLEEVILYRMKNEMFAESPERKRECAKIGHRPELDIGWERPVGSAMGLRGVLLSGLNCSPPERDVEVLSCSSSECDFIWE